jgi:hypothetical protein
MTPLLIALATTSLPMGAQAEPVEAWNIPLRQAQGEREEGKSGVQRPRCKTRYFRRMSGGATLQTRNDGTPCFQLAFRISNSSDPV